MYKKRITIAALVLFLTGGFLLGGFPQAADAKAATANEQTSPFLDDKMDKDLKKILSRQSPTLLGIYLTTMFTSTDERIHNLKKAVKKINGIELGPNETFSYNETVGNSNIAKDGWKQAGAYVGGKLVEDYGGGICQVSSTLYNAAEEAGMVMVERHSHSKVVPYVPQGKDATVAYGVLDFKFTNPYDYPVKIKAKVYDDAYVLVRIVKA